MSSKRIQILGLHTCNPIVSYHNQIFSCSWADQIGTELVFAHPDTDPDTDHTLTTPLRKGPAFELLAANSVKILGRKANIISSSGPGLVQDPVIHSNSNLTDTLPSQASNTGGVPRRPESSSHQAHFISRLQSLKNAKGQADPVRTVMSTRRNVNFTERLSAWARTEAQMAEIASLNKRAANGDQEALAVLEQMIRDLNEPEDTPDPS